MTLVFFVGFSGNYELLKVLTPYTKIKITYTNTFHMCLFECESSMMQKKTKNTHPRKINRCMLIESDYDFYQIIFIFSNQNKRQINIKFSNILFRWFFLFVSEEMNSIQNSDWIHWLHWFILIYGKFNLKTNLYNFQSTERRKKSTDTHTHTHTSHIHRIHNLLAVDVCIVNIKYEHAFALYFIVQRIIEFNFLQDYFDI